MFTLNLGRGETGSSKGEVEGWWFRSLELLNITRNDIRLGTSNGAKIIKSGRFISQCT